MSAIDKAIAWARAIAFDDAHGYDQGSRWGPDYDCSSLVISAWKQAGVPLTSTYTGNMRADMLAHGFRDVTDRVNQYSGVGLERGDVLLHERNHTALYIGSGQIVNAGGNEHGGATGGRTGDQTGREIAVIGYYRPGCGWDCVLRYAEDPSSANDGEREPGLSAAAPLAGQSESWPANGKSGKAEGKTAGGLYTVKSGDSLWRIAERELGDGFRYEELRQLNGLDGTMIYPGQVLKLPGRSDEGVRPHAEDAYVTVTVKVKETTLAWWKTQAAAMGTTPGGYIDALADE